MKKLHFIIYISILHFITFNLQVEAQQAAWVKQLVQTQTPYNFQDKIQIYSIARDNDNNVIIGGALRGRGDFNYGGAGGVITSYYSSWHSEDPFIAKYDQNGNFLWVRRLISLQGLGRTTSIVVDASNNIYAAGSQYVTGLQSFLTRYTSAGTQSYYYQIEGYESSIGSNMLTLDNSGNLYVFNRFTGTKDLDPTAGVSNHTAVGSYDAYIAKFTASTGAFAWAKTFGIAGGSGHMEAHDIVTDGTHLYVTGSFTGTVDFDPNAGVVNRTSAGQTDVFIARYFCSTGAYSYVYTYGGTGYDRGYRLAIDGDFLYFSAQYIGTVNFQQGGTYNLTSANAGADMSFAGFRMSKSNLTVSWGYNLPFNGPPKMAVLGNGILMAHGFNGTQDFDPGPGVFNLTNSFSAGAVLYLDQNRNFQWAILSEQPASSSYYKNIAPDLNETGFFFGTDFITSTVVDPAGSNISLAHGVAGKDALVAYFTISCIAAAPGGTGLWTWTGDVDTDWFEPCNWDKSSVPTSTADVLIPGAPSNQPVIASGNAHCLTIEIQSTSGASLTIQPTGDLQVHL